MKTNTVRPYRVVRLNNNEVTFFYNKHSKEFTPAAIEYPSRINNHVGLKEALKVLEDLRPTTNGTMFIDYI